MKVNFNILRIGKIRKNNIAELILKKDLDFLKLNIRDQLSDLNNENKSNSISIDLIIPAKGYKIKIALNEIKSKEVRKILKENFSNNLYKGKYSNILDNIHNRVF